MEILEAVYIEGITHQPPRLPTKLFSIFESLWKVLKKLPDYREYSKHYEHRINFSNLWR
jgi:hypothetical protein